MSKIKLKGLSLFANVGVAETYLKEVGVEIYLANELKRDRAEFYRHLYPECEMVIGDIKSDELRQFIIKKAKEKKIDFIMATPPCQGMSKHGKQDPYDLRNQLVSYAIDVIKSVKPKFVLLENVPRQLKTRIEYNGDRVLIPEYIRMELSKDYYINSNSVINSAYYKVPQSRERSIFLLSRKDTNIIWEHPEPEKDIVTLRQAIGHLPSIDPFIREEKERWRFPQYEEKKKKALEISIWNYPPTHSWRHIEWMMHTPSGKTAFENKIYFPQKPDGTTITGRVSTYKRFSWDKPANTITQNNGVISSSVCVHPGREISSDGTEKGRIISDPRVLTIYELLIVSSLPTNWNIPMWANEKLIRNVIGEGIPPLLVKKIVQNLTVKI
ncbi:DNA cytosine methyltransferase [Clostridium sporogenes]|uniref:DNA cytosine methyltransferase n=1 Tax=Clostridium sporogenes TaxID=1509 RepID=UPI0022386542|nr:DNA cytosine methyltransferase [Clostridium sporogenes]MCW6107830.1 DNA cytosine methyltransferase [Clostridium sporogenes]